MRFRWTLCNAAMLFLALTYASAGARGASAPTRVYLPQDSSVTGSHATCVGRLAQNDEITAVIALPLRNEPQLEQFLRRVADPEDPYYDRYLTPDQFAADFCPTQAQYDAVAQFAQSEGLTISGTHPNRRLLDVSGSRDAFENAFGVHLSWFKSADGHVFHEPDRTPSVPAYVAKDIFAVVGLSDAQRFHTNYQIRDDSDVANAVAGPGTGPDGGLAPSDIRTAYNLTGASRTGAGQRLGVFELDGYNTSDIAAYEKQFSLPAVNVTNELIDGAKGTAGPQDTEVCLDIEMQIALDPGANRIKVYETPNTDPGVLDGYDKIATEDFATESSTSWGLDEPDSTTAYVQSEAPAFQQMAAQGQSMFASAGDDGAYDSGVVSDGVTVDDPASDPYVCAVGGTSLTTVSPGGAWKSETTWNNGSVDDGAGGGGISVVWSIPTWQVSAITAASGASSTMRNVPDVSLNANQNVGYAVYVDGGWAVIGGTSAASPLWAAFTGLVNQERLHLGLNVLGQADPALYPILQTSDYDTVFHDIADGSNNLFYTAVTGYDDATGLGTFQGEQLLDVLSGLPPGGIPAAPLNLSANPENNKVALNWEVSLGTTTYVVHRSLQSDSDFAIVGSSSKPQFTDSSVSNGTTYYYYVTAAVSGGSSGPSNTVSVVPEIPIIALYQPGINFISLPYDYSDASLPSIFGYGNPVLDLWDPSANKYLKGPASPLSHVHLGYGYWVNFPKEVTVILPGTAASTTSNFKMTLPPGWNQIGDPFATSVNLSSITVVSGGFSYAYDDAVNAGLVWDLLYSYSPGAQSYQAIGLGGAISPGQGYWIGTLANVTLEIPPPASPTF